MRQELAEHFWPADRQERESVQRGAKRAAFIGMLLLFAVLLGGMMPESAEAVCPKNANILGDTLVKTCWECMFPISLFGFTLTELGEDSTRPAVGPGISAVYPPQLCGCVCLTPYLCVPGIPLGIWEPVRLVEIVRTPLCFPALNGITLGPEFVFEGRGSANTNMDSSDLDFTFYHSHFYIFPLWAIVGIAVDWACVNPSAVGDEIDLAYLSEIDPSWNDDLLALILFPEALLLGNPLTVAACAADSLAASAGFPIDPLFWCAGSFGLMYPTTGNVSESSGQLKPAALAMSRLLARLARFGTEFYTAGDGPLICTDFPTGLIVKSQYKYQLLYPIPNVPAPCCQPIGRTVLMWGMGKMVPVIGEDFVFLLWKLQRCCLL